MGFSDPFAASDDPFASTSNGLAKKDTDNFDPFSLEKDPFAPSITTPSKSKVDFDSPFGTSSAWNGNNRTADPFAAAVAADNNNKSSSSWGDDFKFSPPSSKQSPLSSTLKSRLSTASLASTKTRSSGESLPKLNEDAQMAWVAAESVRLEQERRRKAELQEKADLEMAIALSKSEMDGRSPPHSDRLI